ncbi:TonB-dependent receptor [Massilia sp. CF038]|uniref:TonB-dependent receptor n=1 Tax=Massilia sp. CF038 TaxID=1881045 RepID=UPI001E621BC6|nr:TonB-dependent receptor [Massilia sp. CF038]
MLVCAAFAGATPVHAQTTPAGDIPEVIVTAQRSAAPASRTPVSMTVLSGEQLAAAALDSPSAVGARLPNVHMDGAPDGLRITIRGVSNADTTEKGDPSAAFMLDGIYIARPQAQDLSFFDIARVEVLRGPQGTLYGRNSTAGVVNVISNAPGQSLEGAVSVDLGNYNSRRASAMLNVPVSPSLALRAAVAYNQHDSYLINRQGTPYTLGGDRDDISARLSAKLALGEQGTLLLRYERSTVKQNNDSHVPSSNFYTFDAAGQPHWKDGSTDERLTNSFVPINAPLQQGSGRAVSDGLSAELEWNLGQARLYYVGSHRRFEHNQRANFYYGITPAFALGVRQRFDGDYKQDSHELRLASQGWGALTAQAGLYWFREQSQVLYSFRDLELLQLPPYYVFPHGPTEATGKAVFAQATYGLSERLRATAGVRFSHDDKSRIGSTNFQQAETFNPATDLRLLNAAELSTSKTTWRLGTEYDLDKSSMLFATVSTGYKAGGFNDGCLAGTSALGIACPAQLAVPENALIYQPETLTSWEAGFKSRFWHNRATLSATAFYYDYANLQLSGVVSVQGAPRFVTTNAGQARVKGLEVEGQLSVTPVDRLSYSLALLDAYYSAYAPDGVTSWAGRKLDRSPTTTFSLGFDHSFVFAASRLKAGLFTRYSSAYDISVPSQLRQYRIASRTQSDLTLAYARDGADWSVHGYVKNLEDKVRPISIDSFGMVVPSAPRTWGARLEYRF